MSFMDRLKEARLKKGMTQEQVAQKIGVAKSTFTGYEKGNSEPSMLTLSKIMNTLEVDANFLWQDEMDFPMSVSYSEMEHIKKYRDLDEPGRKHTENILEWETERVKTLKKELNEKAQQATRIAELEAARQTSATRQIMPFIDFQPCVSNESWMVEYFRSASAGDGVFIMGSEGTEQVQIPDVPGASETDYAIKISGTSMEPDYHDGDVALVSRTAEMHYGDVGIFVINGNAYIKEYGQYELISRNPESPNIKIAEYDNIVCMGKVVGKIREEDMTRA